MNFYLYIYILLLFLSRAFIPQLSRDSAEIGWPVLFANWDNQKRFGFECVGFLVQGTPACVHCAILVTLVVSPSFFYANLAPPSTPEDTLRSVLKVFLLCGWEWAFSVYVTKWANATFSGTQTKKRESFWVNNNMTLFIEFDVYI